MRTLHFGLRVADLDVDVAQSSEELAIQITPKED
jgi:hypothetical protein